MFPRQILIYLDREGVGGGTEVARVIVIPTRISSSLLSPSSVIQIIAPVPRRRRRDDISTSTATTAITTCPRSLAASASPVALQGYATPFSIASVDRHGRTRGLRKMAHLCSCLGEASRAMMTGRWRQLQDMFWPLGAAAGGDGGGGSGGGGGATVAWSSVLKEEE
jgi:hypothetical protein